LVANWSGLKKEKKDIGIGPWLCRLSYRLAPLRVDETHQRSSGWGEKKKKKKKKRGEKGDEKIRLLLKKPAFKLFSKRGECAGPPITAVAAQGKGKKTGDEEWGRTKHRVLNRMTLEPFLQIGRGSDMNSSPAKNQPPGKEHRNCKEKKRTCRYHQL